MLLDHNANVNSRTRDDETPLHGTISYDDRHPDEKRVGIVQRLLEHGADATDPTACDDNHSTPLYQASKKGLVEVARVLLSYDAYVDEEGEGGAPFQVTSLNRHDETTKMLLEHGAVSQP
ncbi:ankyrin repeat-containing domain protein [Lactarius indigo]|nr:ankyrin repeat-containing domain protein [Lactarius indigo]